MVLNQSKRLKHRSKKIEFSKVIIFSVFFINMVVIGFSMIMIAITHDLSPLCYLIPSVGAEVAAATSSYYLKAKTENKIKLMKSYGMEIHNEDFNNI